MSLDRFFHFLSYAAVFCGFLTLCVTGTFGFFESALFVCVITGAWMLEGSRWQIAERPGTVLIILALPAFFLAYRLGLFAFASTETAIAGILARMILALSAVKLLQKKSDRDWIFLYLMSFFELLLAAGLSISLLYLVSFVLYFIVMVCAVIAFEMRKTGKEVNGRVRLDSGNRPAGASPLTMRKLPGAALVLVFLIVIVAAPLFFLLPRVGGAGLGSFSNALSTQIGFSDTVRLGGIGTLQQSDAVVMRVKLEGNAAPDRDLYFRGTALDTFKNLSWSKSTDHKEPFDSRDRDLIQLDFATGRSSLLVQTIYLEPLDVPVLFAVPRAVAIQGNFPVLFKDHFGAITSQSLKDRISYKVLSDISLPSPDRLRSDDQPYSTDVANYLQLPDQFDHRISELSERVARPALSRYDKALAIEKYLKNSYGYTLEMKSSGPEPVADFLFRVKEGHCEYFASAMALMLRTQGIATRIVNGFRDGEFNDAAGMYVVRQRHAHAWVEVYFPRDNAWVPFDPTPASTELGGANAGLLAKAGKYLEAMDALWIQYFVAFDNQGQRSLARTMRDGFADYQMKTASYASHAQSLFSAWLAEVRGDNGVRSSAVAISYGAAYLAGLILVVVLFVWLYFRVLRFAVWKRIAVGFGRQGSSAIRYHERLVKILSAKGYDRSPDLTPLEFASSVGEPFSIIITEKYNAVRFGDATLSSAEAENIENWLTAIENNLSPAHKK